MSAIICTGDVPQAAATRRGLARHHHDLDVNVQGRMRKVERGKWQNSKATFSRIQVGVADRDCFNSG